MSKLHWCTDPLADCYNTINVTGIVDSDLITKITSDLLNVLVVPSRNDTSRNTLTNAKKDNDPEYSIVKLSNGDECKVNQAFLNDVSILSTEFDLDELFTTELLYLSSETQFKTGTTFNDTGRIVFYSRYQYILNILGYLSSSKNLHLLGDTLVLFDNLLKSFDKIYTLLNTLNDLIDKQNITNNINDIQFINAINYSKSQLFKSHETLGQVLFSIFDNYFDVYGTLANYQKLIAHVNKNIQDGDVFILHYLPSLFKFMSNLLGDADFDASDSLVSTFHKDITTSLAGDHKLVHVNDHLDLSQSKLSSIEIFINMFFFTYFTSWCKQSNQRIEKYDYKEDILKYIELLIDYEVMERLLCFAAESSNFQTKLDFDWNNMYDFRSLLQKSFPRLTPLKFIYPQEIALRPNLSLLLDLTSYKVDSEFLELLLAPFFHKFFLDFITNSALVLISLRDTEEDFLLSSINRKSEENHDDFDDDEKISPKNGSLNMEEIATRSDLERFYLAFAYTYSNRPELCTLFWSSENLATDIFGFFSWSLSNNTSPLITATFCLLLGALTFGDESSERIWEILVNNNSNIKKNDYSKISIDSIIDSLNYYITSLNENFEEDLNDRIKIQQKRQEFLFSSQNDSHDNHEDRIVIELSEDSIVFISGFVQLISSIVKNLSGKSERSREIKSIAFTRFSPVVNGFLKFDNLVSGSGGNLSVDVGVNNPGKPKLIDLPNVLVDTENRAILVNLSLKFLNDLVDNNLSIRYEVWRILDRWLYQSLPSSTIGKEEKETIMFPHQSKPKYAIKRGLRINQAFLNLSSISQVSNFITLVSSLLKPIKNPAFTKYHLLYPADLGSGYRNQIGIWPYIEYILIEVFGKSESIPNTEDQFNVQLQIVEIIGNSLTEIDWKFLNVTAAKALYGKIDYNGLFDSLLSHVHLDLNLFVRLHHSVAILSYLFDERAYKALFKIVSISNDAAIRSKSVSSLISTSLKIVESIVDVQETFINNLLPMFHDNSTPASKTPAGFNTSMSLALTTPKTIFDNIYFPKSIGTQALSNFFEIFLFNLPVISHFALYTGNSDISISGPAIKILGKIGESPFFVAQNNGTVLRKNRLLTTFESVDESVKIKFAFIEQFENYDQSLEIKYKILEFLKDDLSRSNSKEPKVAHFLLGYEIRGGRLYLDASEDSENTLLKALLNTLDVGLNLISEIDYNNGNIHMIDIGPAKLSALILQILVKLSRTAISSTVTLDHLRDYNLFEKLISYQPKIDLDSVWGGKTFDGDLQEGATNQFMEDHSSIQTFFAFINQRNLILQYLSLEFHNIKSASKKDYYINLLLKNDEFLDGSPKILNFLDILNFNFKNFEVHKFENFNQKYNLHYILETVKQDSFLDLSILEKMVKLICQNSNVNTDVEKLAFSNEVIFEGNKIREFVTKFLVSTNLREIQLECLHSWCQLIEILITDSTIGSKYFILEVLQVILPKINDYLESDISFSEELISLGVLLFDLYDKEILIGSEKEDFVLGIQRLIPFFKTCITGILNSNSTPSLRSDLYVLTNKFLLKIFDNEVLSKEISLIIGSVDKKLVEIVGNDSIYSEGSSRITSILLLESLVHLGSKAKSNFALDLLVKTNSLLLLVRSIRRTDEMLQLCSSEESGVTLESLLYELTAFKSTLYFLIRVAQSKSGSLQLIQCELFSILKVSNFLTINPDLGLSLKIEDNQDLKGIRINLKLDTPLALNDVDSNDLNDENNISYFEFLVPIFQLVATLVLSMGPSYKPTLVQTKELLATFNTLVVGVMKRDVLIENNDVKKIYKNDSYSLVGLKELVRLFTLLDSLVNYERE